MNNIENLPKSYQLVVGFDDVDYARVVYFSRYFQYAERAQADMLRKYIYSQSRLAEEFNVGNPIVQVENKYHAPARLDDRIIVHYQVKNLSRRKFEFLFDIYKEGEENTILCKGKMIHRFIDMKNFKGIELDDELYDRFKCLETEGE